MLRIKANTNWDALTISHATLPSTDNEAEPLDGSPALFSRAACPLIVYQQWAKSQLIFAQSSFVHNPVHKVRSNLNELWLMDRLHCSPGPFIRKSLLGWPFGHWCYRKYISKGTLKSRNLDRTVILKVGCGGIKSYSRWQVSRSVAFQRLHFNVSRKVENIAEYLIADKIFPLGVADIPTLTSVGSHVAPGVSWSCLESNVTPLTWIAETSDWSS